MRLVMITAAVAALAGCATPAAYTELAEAQKLLELHDKAAIFINIDLVDTVGTTEAQRAPRVETLRAQVMGCDAAFKDGFVATLQQAGERADGMAFAIARAGELDAAFDACVRPHGLTGYPEFQVGDRFLHTPTFIRSYYTAGEREIAAHRAVDAQGSANGMAFAAAIGGAGRAAATYQPAPAIIPAPQSQIRCTSYRYGMYLNTTCR